MDTVLGFIVLTSPLWFLLVLLFIAIWLARKVARRFERRGAKIAARLAVFLLIVFVPFADEITGRAYLEYLCNTGAGARVYQTVELPAEYWDQRGQPRFIKGRALNLAVLTNYDVNVKLEKHSAFPPIRSFRFEYIEKQSGKVLGEIVDFQFVGGWVAQNFSPAPGSGASCGQSRLGDSRQIVLSIFKPAITQNRW